MSEVIVTYVLFVVLIVLFVLAFQKNGIPGRPYISASDNNFIRNAFTLQWHENQSLENYEAYQVKYKETEGKWNIYDHDKSISQPTILIYGLKPNTSYIFKVRVTNCHTSEGGPFSDESEIIKTKTSATNFLMSRSELIQENGPRIYMLPVSEVKPYRDEFRLTRKYILGRWKRLQLIHSI